MERWLRGYPGLGLGCYPGTALGLGLVPGGSCPGGSPQSCCCRSPLCGCPLLPSSLPAGETARLESRRNPRSRGGRAWVSGQLGTPWGQGQPGALCFGKPALRWPFVFSAGGSPVDAWGMQEKCTTEGGLTDSPVRNPPVQVCDQKALKSAFGYAQFLAVCSPVHF